MKFLGKKIYGFTLIEALVTIAIVSIGIIGSTNLLNNSFYLGVVAQNKLIASNLAQEGFELVRNVRDSNYISGLASTQWLSGLQNCQLPSGCMVSINPSNPTGAISVLAAPVFSSNTPPQMCYGSGYYYYDSNNLLCPTNTQVPFARVVHISSVSADEIKVVVNVFWQQRGVWQNSGNMFEYHLYNWRQ